mmetsp:Transcript_41279/g.41899  ORF Transcript_41279/g.41899 Transcript_41279/m.41899 type:complete len:98 (+) Transcript_41279:188-481(+)
MLRSIVFPAGLRQGNDECSHPGLLARTKFLMRVLVFDSNGPYVGIAAIARRIGMTNDYWPFWIVLEMMGFDHAGRRKGVTYWVPGAIVLCEYCGQQI